MCNQRVLWLILHEMLGKFCGNMWGCCRVPCEVGQELMNIWLAVLYALIVLPLIANMIVLLALLDSWYDFRTRLQKPA